MKGIIAKKYVNALMKSCNDSELVVAEKSINEISGAFSSIKFINIIDSPDLSNEKKEEFILSMVDKSEQKVVNFLRLLASNDRLSMLPSIAKELKYQTSIKENSFVGKIISNFEVDSDYIVKIEEGFSKKFNAHIKLNSVVSDYPGIKIELDDLGIEVSFSLDRLKTQMVEHILKAI